MQLSNSLKAAILLCLASLFWSGNFIVGRLASTESIISPLSLGFYRWVIAFIILTPFCLPSSIKVFNKIKKQPLTFFLIILTGPTLFNTFIYLGLTSTKVINALLIVSTTPMLIILFNFLLFKIQSSKIQFLGIIISLVGVSYVITKGNYYNFFNSEFYGGDIFIILAVICWAIYSIFLKKNETGIEGLSFLYMSFGFTVLFLFPIYLFDIFILNHSIVISPISILTIGYTGIFPSIFSYLFWNMGVTLIGANKSGPFLHLMPIFGGILAFLVFQETLESYHYVGIISVFLGILITHKK